MPCVHPIPAYRERHGSITFTQPKACKGYTTDTAEPIFTATELHQLQLPCGTCIECRRAQARAWALRCTLEYSQHQRVAFTTLTYDDSHLPNTLQKRDLQLFLKRARQRLARSLPARQLRFFAAGEYGETTNRPHYHAILFGADKRDSALIQDTWALGFTSTEHATPASIAYTAGYCAKKLSDNYRRWWPEHMYERINYETGEVYRYQPPFLQMSRRPGIGGAARQFTNSWRDHAILNGAKLAVPRFLRKAWDELASPEQQEQLSYETYKRTALTDTSPQRLQAIEQIALAKQQLAAAKRKL